MDLSDRYQSQPWLVRLWRRRWYCLIPFEAVRAWLHNAKKINFEACWSIAIGSAQTRMKWWFTMEEVFGNCDSEGADV